MNEHTTADYLNQLEQDRQDLVDNLETKGITGLTGDETFTELVPEVLNISGGLTIPTNFEELRTQLDTLSTNFVNYINNLILNRTAYTNESVTLYTPASTHTKYVIHKRSSGKYRVVWVNSPFVLHNNTTSLYQGVYANTYSTTTIVNNNLTSMYFANPNMTTVSNITGYYSNEVDTIEDVINGMKNNTLTYNSATGFYGMVEDYPLIIPYSNILCATTVGFQYAHFLDTQIISHNENFEVIS